MKKIAERLAQMKFQIFQVRITGKFAVTELQGFPGANPTSLLKALLYRSMIRLS
jgi:hypothetical protein